MSSGRQERGSSGFRRLSLADPKGGIMPARRPSNARYDSVEAGVPACVHWSIEDVGNWIDWIGFPNYVECFKNNFITGKRLILVNASTLPSMGIHDFENIKLIQRHIRNLLGISFVSDNHSIADPYTDAIGLYLEDKCVTKISPSPLTLKEIKDKFECLKLEPPLYKMNLL